VFTLVLLFVFPVLVISGAFALLSSLGRRERALPAVARSCQVTRLSSLLTEDDS